MIYITGDVHGDLSDLDSRNIGKIKKGDTLFITGDFGFIWDNSKSEIKALKKLSKRKYNIVFVEGVHENFDMLYEYEELPFQGATAHKIADNIYCLKRGEIYTIEGKTVFVLGGGTVDDPFENADPDPTCDKAMPTDEILQMAVDNLRKENRKVDLIITHEAPASVKRLIRRDSNINDLNIFLDTILHNVKYQNWYFGSLHTDRAISENLCCVWQEVHKID